MTSFLTHEEFRRELKRTFGLEYRIYKSKHGFDMVDWQSGGSGDVAGAFAGHSHNCSIPHFSYKGWVFAYINNEWRTMPDGISGWRERGSANPFPQCAEHEYRSLW